MKVLVDLKNDISQQKVQEENTNKALQELATVDVDIDTEIPNE